MMNTELDVVDDEPNNMLYARIFASAIGNLLRNTEGICVVVDDHKYFVYVDGESVFIDPADDSDTEAGTLLWMHRDTIQ